MAQALDQFVIEPDDGEALVAASHRLADEFESWLAGQDLDPDDAWVAYPLMQMKWTYLDGALTRWTSADLRELLLDVFPRRVVVHDDAVDRLVPAAARFLEFLCARELLDAGGESLAALEEELGRLAPAVAEAMRDPSRFAPSKALLVSMAGDGVDLDDPDAVDEWIEAFTADGGTDTLDAPAPSVPPADLPDEPALAEAAQATPIARWTVAFVGWVGAGRKLTQAGNLRVADGKVLVEVLGTFDTIDPRHGDRTYATRSSTDLGGVDLAFRVALHAGLARRRRGRLVTTGRGRQAVRDPLEAWRAATAALLDLGVLTWRDNQWRPWWHEPLDGGAEELLVALHLLGETDVAFLAATAIDTIDAQSDLDGLPEVQRERLPAGITRGVEVLVDRLEWLGAVTWRDAEVVDLTGVPARRGGRVALTPLGEWFVRPLLAERGHDTTVVADWAEADAGDLLAAAVRWPAERAAATVRRWARDRRTATEELLAAARASTDVTVRVGVVEAVAAIADDAGAAVHRLRDEPVLRPLATLWLISHGLLGPDELDPDEFVPVLAEQLAYMLAQGGADAVIEALAEGRTLLGSGPVLKMVEGLWRYPGASTAAVLDALAASDDKAVAKAARRARFKLRSAR